MILMRWTNSDQMPDIGIYEVREWRGRIISSTLMYSQVSSLQDWRRHLLYSMWILNHHPWDQPQASSHRSAVIERWCQQQGSRAFHHKTHLIWKPSSLVQHRASSARRNRWGWMMIVLSQEALASSRRCMPLMKHSKMQGPGHRWGVNWLRITSSMWSQMDPTSDLTPCGLHMWMWHNTWNLSSPKQKHSRWIRLPSSLIWQIRSRITLYQIMIWERSWSNSWRMCKRYYTCNSRTRSRRYSATWKSSNTCTLWRGRRSRVS